MAFIRTPRAYSQISLLAQSWVIGANKINIQSIAIGHFKKQPIVIAITIGQFKKQPIVIAITIGL